MVQHCDLGEEATHESCHGARPVSEGSRGHYRSEFRRVRGQKGQTQETQTSAHVQNGCGPEARCPANNGDLLKLVSKGEGTWNKSGGKA